MKGVVVCLLLAACARGRNTPEIVRIHPSSVTYAYERDAGEPAVLSTAASGVQYQLRALWRFGDDAWQPVGVRGSAMRVEGQVPLRAFVGARLPDGLYYAVATANGRCECSLVFHGVALCNDVDVGAAPEGMIAACVPSTSGATARVIRDPAYLCRP
jgi:hypothetical protein